MYAVKFRSRTHQVGLHVIVRGPISSVPDDVASGYSRHSGAIICDQQGIRERVAYRRVSVGKRVGTDECVAVTWNLVDGQ